MALADIISKIKSDAEAEAKRITDEAENQAQDIIASADGEASSVTSLGQTDAERAASKTRGRIVAGATHEAKFAVQAFRVSLIERVFGDVEKTLSKLSKDEYAAFVESRAKTLPEKEGALTVSSERKDETLEVLKKMGVHATQTEEKPLLGGFVLETKTAVYDHSIRTLVKQARNEHSGLVARTLFGN